MSRKFDIYGIGNAIVDLQVSATDRDLELLKLTKSTMHLVGEEEQKRLAEHFGDLTSYRSSGGSAANTMIAFAQLGGRAAYGSVVGADEDGAFYRQDMESLRVLFHNPPRNGLKTGTSFILITPDAERTMNTFLGATATFGPADVSEEILAQSSWLFVEGYLFSTVSGREAVSWALNAAKRNGVKVALTFSDVFIVSEFREALEKAVAGSDLIFANSNEARAFAGAGSEEEAFAELGTRCPMIAMTRSEKGAWIRVGGEEERIDAYPVQAVDDTGAGDAFAGGFLYGLSRSMDLRAAGTLANFLAGRVVAQLGARIRGDVRLEEGWEW